MTYRILNEYVAWVDIMGTGISMSRSLRRSANFVFKLHEAALQASKQNVILYPVMDGFYASSPNWDNMQKFLRDVFQCVAKIFNKENEPEHRFIIKGAVAFGPVIHGQRSPRDAAPIMDDNKQYRDKILLGLPMVQASTTEKCAPPFGIFVHESVRTESVRKEVERKQNQCEQSVRTSSSDGKPSRMSYIWWKWEDSKNDTTWCKLRTELESYYEWWIRPCPH